MRKKFIKCSHCGIPIYEGSTCLEHEYGAKYCSPVCLLEGGFYGHWKSYDLSEDRLDDEEFEVE